MPELRIGIINCIKTRCYDSFHTGFSTHRPNLSLRVGLSVNQNVFHFITGRIINIRLYPNLCPIIQSYRWTDIQAYPVSIFIHTFHFDKPAIRLHNHQLTRYDPHTGLDPYSIIQSILFRQHNRIIDNISFIPCQILHFITFLRFDPNVKSRQSGITRILSYRLTALHHIQYTVLRLFIGNPIIFPEFNDNVGFSGDLHSCLIPAYRNRSSVRPVYCKRFNQISRWQRIYNHIQ